MSIWAHKNALAEAAAAEAAAAEAAAAGSGRWILDSDVDGTGAAAPSGLQLELSPRPSPSGLSTVPAPLTTLLAGEGALNDGDHEDHIVDVLLEMGLTRVEIRNGTQREELERIVQNVRAMWPEMECRLVPQPVEGGIDLYLVDRLSHGAVRLRSVSL